MASAYAALTGVPRFTCLNSRGCSCSLGLVQMYQGYLPPRNATMPLFQICGRRVGAAGHDVNSQPRQRKDGALAPSQLRSITHRTKLKLRPYGDSGDGCSTFRTPPAALAMSREQAFLTVQGAHTVAE